MIELISPADGVKISLLTDVHREFLRRDELGLNKDVEALEQLFEPIWQSRWFEESASLFIKWKTDEAYVPMKPELSFDEDFCELCPANSAMIGEMAYDAVDGVYTVRVDNLMLGKTYYWRVNDGKGNYKVRSFSTGDECVRPIRSAVRNMRDLGGRITADGKRVKQGLLFRSYAPEADDQKPYELSYEAKDVIINKLGIKTEIDLREENFGIRSSSGFEGVNYAVFPLEGYSGLYADEMKLVYKAVLEMLADESNYPIFYHCAVGADRTGTVSFLVESILNERPESIMLDYALSCFVAQPRYMYTDWMEFHKTLSRKFPAENLREQFMRVVREQLEIDEGIIEKIRSIMLE